MKVIFLDIDGVLNSDEYYRSVDRTIKEWSRFDPRVAKMITNLVEEFSAKIVITSTWRFGAVKLLNKELKRSGLRKYLHNDWKSPQVHPSHRGTEIKMWVDKHPEVVNYLILDDDTNMLEEQVTHFVRTDLRIGMLDEHIRKANEILSTH